MIEQPAELNRIADNNANKVTLGFTPIPNSILR